MLPFSVSQFTTWHQSFEEDIALYARLGLKRIEICQRKLSPDPAKARDQLKLILDAGLTVTSVQPRVHALFPDSMAPDILDPVERIARFRETIDLFSSAFPGQNLPLVAISGNAPNYNFRLCHETARKLYPDLARYAADHGVRVAFEPLNPILMNADAFITSLNGAMDLIHDVNHPNFGLMLDVWHVWSEPNINERVAQIPGQQIFAVHLCDWPKGEPRSIGDRVLPGDGIIDLPALIRSIHSTGYRGTYCLEIFSIDELPDSLWKADPAKVIERARTQFAPIWSQATR